MNTCMLSLATMAAMSLTAQAPTCHDNAARTFAGVIGPNESLLMAVRAPASKYIRKLRLRSPDGESPVTINSLAFILARRNELGEAE